MKSVWVAVGSSCKRSLLLLAVLLGLVFFVPRAVAKISTDFDPNLDFSQLKTFAFTGGVEQLVRLQLNPDQLNDRIHRSVVGELTAKGLREVPPEENPDLVVRYWVNSQKDVDVASSVIARTLDLFARLTPQKMLETSKAELVSCMTRKQVVGT
jgi:uncharacterized protein DUF4136